MMTIITIILIVIALIIAITVSLAIWAVKGIVDEGKGEENDIYD